MELGGYMYIMASQKNGTLYVGKAENLVKRVAEHKQDVVDGFTKKYHVHTLVYFESYEQVEGASLREKQLKEWKRIWKIQLIEQSNPEWRDLFEDLLKG
jgi:putative endonuclease